MMDRLLTAGLCGNTIEQDIQTRGDSRVSGYPGLSPKIQDLLLLHIDDWPVYYQVYMSVRSTSFRGRFLTGVTLNCGSSF